MASCQNCNNLLPRTVDRCPVCGAVPPAPDAPTPEINNTPGWSTDSQVPDPSDVLSPDAVLTDRGARQAPVAPSAPVNPSTPPQAPGAADATTTKGGRAKRAFTPPPIPTGLDPTTPAMATPVPSAWGGSGPERLPATSEAGEILDERSVKAMSSRVEGNIVTGRKAQHKVVVAAALAIGAATLGLGAWGGLIAYNATDSALAYADGNPTDSAFVDSWLERNGNAFVSVRVNGCTGAATNAAIAVDPRTVLVLASDVESDPTLTVIDAEGIERNGQTIAVDASRDLAVVRLTEPLPASVSWGSTQRVVNQAVSVIPLDHATRDDESRTIAATVVDVVQRGNEVIGFTLDVESDHGSAVIDSNGLLIGIVGTGGENAASAEELGAFVSTSILNPSRPRAVCPAPPTTLPPEGQDDEAGD